MPALLLKKCSTCLRSLELPAFGKCTREKDGLQKQCRACRKELSASYYQRHRTEILAKIKAKKQQEKTP